MNLTTEDMDLYFWPKARLDDRGCLVWTAARDRNGYGVWNPPKASGLRNGVAHKYAWVWVNGPVPDGLELDHLCRNRSCVNPAHLEPVTHAENMRRSSQSLTHCRSGHAYDEANTLVDRRGHKRCRACNRERSRIAQGYYERRRAA